MPTVPCRHARLRFRSSSFHRRDLYPLNPPSHPHSPHIRALYPSPPRVSLGNCLRTTSSWNRVGPARKMNFDKSFGRHDASLNRVYFDAPPPAHSTLASSRVSPQGVSRGRLSPVLHVRAAYTFFFMAVTSYTRYALLVVNISGYRICR